MIIIALAVGPPAGMLWLQRRHPSVNKPHQWPWRALAVALPQAMALGFALNAVPDEDALAPPQLILLVLAVALVPGVTAELARRSLLRPLVVELGAGEFEVLVEPRTGQRSWFYSDSVTLTDRKIVITVRSGSGRATWHPKTEQIALAEVTAVGARTVLPQDSPWITLSDGRGLTVTPGDVVWSSAAGNMEWPARCCHGAGAAPGVRTPAMADPRGRPRELATIISRRAAAAPRREIPPLSVTQWHHLQSWAARQLTTSRHKLRLRQRRQRVAARQPRLGRVAVRPRTAGWLGTVVERL